jgi:hypothetical protein
VGETCDDDGELAAALASYEVRNDVCHVGCRCLAVEHE